MDGLRQHLEQQNGQGQSSAQGQEHGQVANSGGSRIGQDVPVTGDIAGYGGVKVERVET